jgi:hypothetical protein
MLQLIAGCLIAVLISGCSQKAPFKELAEGLCTSAEEKLVDQHISGQIDALAEQDWKSAYSFASDKFRAQVPLDQFILGIGSQYSMLINNQGYTFDQCKVQDGRVIQDINVTSRSKVYSLTYELSINESILGIETAVINPTETGLNT